MDSGLHHQERKLPLLLPRAPAPGLKRFVHLKKTSLMRLSLCCSHTREIVEQIECLHPSPLHWTAGGGRGHKGQGFWSPEGAPGTVRNAPHPSHTQMCLLAPVQS